MPRYKLLIEYDGGPFVGWQRQENGPSIQEAVEEAARLLSGESVAVHGAGRTDAGVHALGMTAHLDLARDYGADVVCDALNHHLKPAPIAILEAEEVSVDFHARFSCTARSYEYRIINRRAPLALDAGKAWRASAPLDAAAMHAAAQVFVGTHDFTTFRAAACQSASPVKSVDKISVSRMGDEIVTRCSARSFLHHQIRSFVGSLVEVGRGKWKARDLKAALEAKDRAACGPVAPAEGLYFVRADYDINR
ncbi:MAG: tRNA pseudouridine(38-40) synthase TruA [Pseudomonadota bacterium]